MSSLMTYETACQRMMDAAHFLGAESVKLDSALGRVLAQDVAADIDSPPFRKSAMDGFACRRADLGGDLSVIESIPAGKVPTLPIGPGQCARIMTGAPVPQGADCVVMVEHAAEVAPGHIRVTQPSKADNICPQGEDGRAGDIVLRRGEMIGPAHIAVLAAVGCICPLLARQPRVSVLATGSELVEPSQQPGAAQIRNSNSYQLCSQLEAMGISATYHGLVPDDRASLAAAIGKAATGSDVLLVCGGVSEGDYDFVPDALKACDFAFEFESVAMQPGKPTVFGQRRAGAGEGEGAGYCCGMPGNPVSTFVVFEILVKPFLYWLMGHHWQKQLVKARLAGSFKRRKADRRAALPVRFTAPDEVTLIDYHGSAHISAMTQCEGLLFVPVGEESIAQGSVVYVRPL